jgi:N-acetyl-1-D-myo-inositol-2-amino-2-deoxy-alpha-D-glucopyranoside deacetylase
MRAHRTQIAVDGMFFALSNNIGQGAFGIEYYRQTRGPTMRDDGRETELFANS